MSPYLDSSAICWNTVLSSVYPEDFGLENNDGKQGSWPPIRPEKHVYVGRQVIPRQGSWVGAVVGSFPEEAVLTEASAAVLPAAASAAALAAAEASDQETSAARLRR